jgi:hypothetical protein
LKASNEERRCEDARQRRLQQRVVIHKPEQEHDGNYTNALVQPVHPAKRNILFDYKFTEYTVVICLLHSLDKSCSEVSEKCTAYFFRVTELSLVECRSNWEE